MAVQTIAQFRNSLNEIPRLRDMLEHFCARHGLAAEIAAKLLLVLEEIHTNVVSYGYGANAASAVSMGIIKAGRQLTLVYVDDAVAFHPNQAPAPLVEVSVEERPVGGLGIHLVQTIMDDVQYIRLDKQNRYIMTKRLADAELD